MSQSAPFSSSSILGQLLLDPLGLTKAANEYAIDAWQRAVLYADVRRQRGNQYQAHLQKEAPNVLDFPAEVVVRGTDLPRPVNYGLARIKPSANMPVDPLKRPFVVVDPRAGHGPGIGGFKPDSEIGAALAAGHPCYFVGFLPDPVPGQTIEDVMRAEAHFMRKVAELHPESVGKPAVIGNCQAGWQILMTAAVWPELFGPIIVAGAPLSYWAGDNPMRYAGGLTGGSWLTALTSDLGAGRFDGAWLVQNFENLDPANTLWTKQYNLYANVDTEAPRYLGFEKYWGGHVFLNDVEMQYITDNLFIGNKLSTAQLMTSDGVSIDLRNIRSPIVVFCSYGDNITPPPQALGWITDLYRDDDDILGHDQTIVFATHDSIGHLGIFVSGSVGRKEHRKFTANIDIIDLLPAGVFRAEIEEAPQQDGADAEQHDPFLMRIRSSGVEEVRSIVKPNPQSDQHFMAAAQLSNINLSLYQNYLQPWVRAVSTSVGAQWLQRLHPARVDYEWWSDAHPLSSYVAETAERVRDQRQPASPDNPFLQAQAAFSQAMVSLLDQYRDSRDQIYAATFTTLCSLPWVQALAGQNLYTTQAPRQHPSETPEHRKFLADQLANLKRAFLVGGEPVAAMRALSYIFGARGEADERHFRHAAEIAPPELRCELDMEAFRQLGRQQALMMRLDSEAALAAIPHLLEGTSAEQIRQTATNIRDVVAAGGALSQQEQARLQQVLDLFEQAARQAQPPADTSKPEPEAAAEAPKPSVSRSISNASPAKPVPKRAATAGREPAKSAARKAPANTPSTPKPSGRRK